MRVLQEPFIKQAGIKLGEPTDLDEGNLTLADHGIESMDGEPCFDRDFLAIQ